jgi:E3 Ubiquitin ligase
VAFQERPVIVCLFLLIPTQSVALISSGAIAAGLYLFAHGFRLLARQRSLLTTPTSKIRGIARGLVEVSGVAAGPCTTLAPVTEEPCFLYRTTAWRQREGKKNAWEKVAEETLHLPFFIDDSTGRLLIEALGADLELNPLFRGEYAPALMDSNEVPLSVVGFLSRHGIALDRVVRIEERLIKADDLLFVAGTLMENPGIRAHPSSPAHPPLARNDMTADRRNPVRSLMSGNVRDTVRTAVRQPNLRIPPRNHPSESLPAPEVVRLTSAAAASSTREMTQQEKIAAALTRASGNPEAWSFDGILDAPVAVEKTGPSATVFSGSEVRQREMRMRGSRTDGLRPDETRNELPLKDSQAGSSDFDLAPPVILMKGTGDSTFIISFRSQKEIVSATTWKAAFVVCGGTAIALLGLYELCVQLALL